MPRNFLPPGHVSAVDKRWEQEQVRHDTAGQASTLGHFLSLPRVHRGRGFSFWLRVTLTKLRAVS
jgi:hypothetical protein